MLRILLHGFSNAAIDPCSQPLINPLIINPARLDQSIIVEIEGRKGEGDYVKDIFLILDVFIGE
jgi:hypothetical protein